MKTYKVKIVCHLMNGTVTWECDPTAKSKREAIEIADLLFDDEVLQGEGWRLIKGDITVDEA